MQRRIVGLRCANKRVLLTNTVSNRAFHCRMRYFIRLLLVALLPFTASAQQDASARLAALAERYYEAQARMDPVYSATLIGDNRFDADLPVDIAPENRRARFAMYRDVLKQLAAIPRAPLSPQDQLTRDTLDQQVRSRLAFERFDDHLLPLEQLDSIPILLANFASGQA